MTKYREILRLKSLGFSERSIAQSAGVSRNTVSKVLKRADELNLKWPLDFGITDNALEEIMFPKEKTATHKRMPDFDYIRKELMRNGVNKNSSGMNIWRNAARLAKKDSSIHSSAGTSSRMSRNAVQLCISPGSRVNRSKLTGLVIRHISSIPIPVRSQMPGSSLVY